MKKYQKKNNTSWHVKFIWNSNFGLQIWSVMAVQPLSPSWPWLALCNTNRAEGVQKRSCGLQVLKHLLSDPLLEKKKEKEKTIPYLLSFKDEKIKPKETKDIRIIQLAFGRKWSESESEVTQWVLFVTPWTVAYEAPPSMGFSRQGCWSGLPFPSPGDLPDWGIKPWSPALQADALPSEPETALKLSHLNPI